MVGGGGPAGVIGLTRSKYIVMVCSGAGLSVGLVVGVVVGAAVGEKLGDVVGSEVVGDTVGESVGAGVGETVTANLLQLSVAGAPQRPRISLRIVA